MADALIELGPAEDWEPPDAPPRRRRPPGAGLTAGLAGLAAAVGLLAADAPAGLLWRRPLDPADAGPVACGRRAWCVSGRDRFTMLDGRTGQAIWQLPGNRDVLASRGDSLLMGIDAHDGNGPRADLAVVDARTGAARAAVTGWQLIGAVPDGRAIVRRHVEGERATTIAVLDPGDGRVVPVGSGENWGTDPSCSADDRVVVCNALGELRVWRLPRRAATA